MGPQADVERYQRTYVRYSAEREGEVALCRCAGRQLQEFEAGGLHQSAGRQCRNVALWQKCVRPSRYTRMIYTLKVPRPPAGAAAGEWSQQASTAAAQMLRGGMPVPLVPGVPLRATLKLTQAPAAFSRPISHRKVFKPPFVVSAKPHSGHFGGRGGGAHTPEIAATPVGISAQSAAAAADLHGEVTAVSSHPKESAPPHEA